MCMCMYVILLVCMCVFDIYLGMSMPLAGALASVLLLNAPPLYITAISWCNKSYTGFARAN